MSWSSTVRVVGLLGVSQTIVRALRGDDDARYLLAEKTARRIHPDVIAGDRDRYWIHDRAFRATFDRFAPEEPRRMERVWMLGQLARRAATMPGETAECGVFKGLSSYVIALACPDKVHHAFDSFEGLSTPSEADGQYWRSGDLAVSLEQVQRNLAGVANVEYHVGWIPDRFVDVADREFALVHIDVDLEEPTREALRFFGDRMAPRGVIVLDDYGSELCPGARRVADEFARTRSLEIVEVPTGQGLILDA